MLTPSALMVSFCFNEVQPYQIHVPFYFLFTMRYVYSCLDLYMIVAAGADTLDTHARDNDVIVAEYRLKTYVDLANIIAESIVRGSIDEDGEAQIFAFARRIILKPSKH